LLCLRHDVEVTSSIAEKLIAVASLHCESPLVPKRIQRYTIEEMLEIKKNMTSFPQLQRFRHYMFKNNTGKGAFSRWEAPKVVKDTDSGSILAVEDETLSMSAMAEAAEAFEMREDGVKRVKSSVEEKEESSVSVVEESRDDFSVVEVEEDEEELTKSSSFQAERVFTTPSLNDVTVKPFGDVNPAISMQSPFLSDPAIEQSYSSSEVFRAYTQPIIIPDPEPPRIPEVPYGMIPDIPDVPFSSYNQGSFVMDSGYAHLEQMPQQQLEQLPQQRQDQSADFPPLPDVDVLVVSDASSAPTEPKTTQEEDADVAGKDSITKGISADQLPELPADVNVVVIEEDKKEPASSAPEKSPKKPTLTPWERNRRREEKEKKKRELKAIRYLAQANPGSIPVSESMKASSLDDEDVDESSEINVHVGVDEAAVSALYHGRIETPPRQPMSRRMHETPNRHQAPRNNIDIRILKNDEASYHEAQDPTELIRTEVRPSSADFPPLGVQANLPAVPQQIVMQTEEPPVQEVPRILQKPRPSEPTVTEDDMMAFFMQ